MGLGIFTNIASINARRNLDSTQSSMNKSLQKLSTGLRINGADDDAAGMAISERLSSQIRGLEVAQRNANDGISLAQIAEGALGEASSALQRIRELALQSVNGSNSGAERTSLNTEVQQLISEVDRIASQTEFNGNKILNTASGFNATFQVGSDVNQTIAVTIDQTNTSQLGVATNYNTIIGEADATLAARMRVQYANALSSATLNGASLDDVSANSDSVAKINAINNSSAGVTSFMYGNSLVASSNAANGAAATAAGELVINGVEIGSTATGSVAQVVAAVNAKSSETGVTADITAGSTAVFFNRTGAAITVQVNSAAMAAVTGFTNGSTNTSAAEANGAIVISADVGTASVSTSSTTAAAALEGSAADTAVGLTDSTLASINVITASSANLAIVTVDRAIDSVSSTRSTLGAIQNRLTSTIAAQAITHENMSAAQSRIRDADFAKESANLVRSQILQQAGTSVLAQANQIPQTALSLLQ